MAKVILEEITPKGRLRVERYDDIEFPGFTLWLDEKQICIFEYDSVKDAICLHVWTDQTEDPSITFRTEF